MSRYVIDSSVILHFLAEDLSCSADHELLAPTLVRSDFKAELSPEQKESLELENLQDGLTYSIVTLTDDPTKVTVNLFAPLVINSANMRASQIALLDSGYAVDEPMLRA